jgi:hypothetical protein
MKRVLCFLLLSGITCLPVTAQVHLKGQRFIDLQAGLTDGFHLAKNEVGLNALLSTGTYNRQYNAWKLTVSGLQKPLALPNRAETIPLRQFAIGWGYEFNLWRRATRTRFLRGFVQPTLLYDSFGAAPTAGGDTTRTIDKNTRFGLGGDIGLAVELSPLIISVRQRWQPKSGIQPFHTLLSAGWRFHR